MEFKELVDGFASRHKVEGLVIEDDAVALDIDGIVVTIVSTGERLAMSADIGDPPSEGLAVFANLLLEANLQSDVVFAKHAESGGYIILRRLPLFSLDVDAFDAALESFVNQAETWRRLLLDFRPIAKAAESDESQRAPLAADGFMQV